MTDIFVSYASADRSLAMAVVEALESQKWGVFWDRGIPAGKKWPDVLQQRLSSASCVLVLLTRESLKSSWVTYEASVALQKRILVPLLLDPDLNPQRDLPEMYRDLHVASMVPNQAALREVGLQEPWLKAVRALVTSGARRRLLRLSVAALLLMFMMIASAYVAVTNHNSLIGWQAGIRFVERGSYSKYENERLKGLIRSAKSIDLLVVNANTFASAFREDLAEFFKNRDVKMRILFADPESEFYREMMIMTTQGISLDAKAIIADKAKLDFSRRAILVAAGESADQVEFKQYSTQFRLPLILLDKKYCFLTLRLTPDQAQESIRFELASSAAGETFDRTVAKVLRSIGFMLSSSKKDRENVESCKNHFDEIWKYSKSME